MLCLTCNLKYVILKLFIFIIVCVWILVPSMVSGADVCYLIGVRIYSDFRQVIISVDEHGVYDFSKDFPDLLNNPKVLEVAEKYGKTPAQILLRHIVQRGIAAIPKSTNPDRIQQNLQVRCNSSKYL